MIGSAMSQINESVGTSVNRSMTAVDGSGMTSMSDSLVACQPRMLDPSKPRPSVKQSSSNSVIGVVQMLRKIGCLSPNWIFVFVAVPSRQKRPLRH